MRITADKIVLDGDELVDAVEAFLAAHAVRRRGSREIRLDVGGLRGPLRDAEVEILERDGRVDRSDRRRNLDEIAGGLAADVSRVGVSSSLVAARGVLCNIERAEARLIVLDTLRRAFDGVRGVAPEIRAEILRLVEGLSV